MTRMDRCYSHWRRCGLENFGIEPSRGSGVLDCVDITWLSPMTPATSSTCTDINGLGPITTFADIQPLASNALFRVFHVM